MCVWGGLRIHTLSALATPKRSHFNHTLCSIRATSASTCVRLAQQHVQSSGGMQFPWRPHGVRVRPRTRSGVALLWPTAAQNRADFVSSVALKCFYFAVFHLPLHYHNYAETILSGKWAPPLIILAVKVRQITIRKFDSCQVVRCSTRLTFSTRTGVMWRVKTLIVN